MLPNLKNHPFPVKAFFDYSIVLTYAIDKTILERLIPPCLSIDTFNNNFGFVALALVQTKQLRPAFFPAILGNDFFLAGYRIFVRYTTNNGKNLRGLYILQSKTDKKLMKILGDTFTHYQYEHIDIINKTNGDERNIRSISGGFNVTVKSADDHLSLPPHSPFANWKEARRFAGPLPFTFSWNAAQNEVLMVEGQRENWQPRPLQVLQEQVAFPMLPGNTSLHLANAFIVENIPYQWKKGRTEIWKGQ